MDFLLRFALYYVDVLISNSTSTVCFSKLHIDAFDFGTCANGTELLPLFPSLSRFVAL